MMYRIAKVLNHNSLIGIHQDDHKGSPDHGKRSSIWQKSCRKNRSKTTGKTGLFSQKYKERGDAKEIIKVIAPEFLELRMQCSIEAEKVFGKIDRSILFPMADHIGFAIRKYRMENHEQISNPLTDDIRVCFPYGIQGSQ